MTTLAYDVFDPTSSVQAQLPAWIHAATGWAQHIYFTLLIFELVALAITTLLFRDNLGEFFASFTLKVFMGGVYFWFINNAGSGTLWPQQVINTFQQIGIQLGGSPNYSFLTVQGLAAATAFFLAGPAAHLGDSTAASFFSPVSGNCVYADGFGYCDTVTPASLQNEGVPFEMIMQGMALMMVMAIFAILLQYILVTIESYIVMGCGILFIGFAGSRFTLPFSQGYFSYMINVGVKFMVFYIILGILQSFMPAILGGAIATLGLSVFGMGSEYGVLVPAAVALFNMVVGAALVWTIPGFCGSFLSGSSSSSGTAALGQAVGSMAGASAMLAQFKQASAGQAAAQQIGTQGRSATMTQNAGAASLAQETMSPTANGQSNGQSFQGEAADRSLDYSAPYNPNSATSIGTNTGSSNGGFALVPGFGAAGMTPGQPPPQTFEPSSLTAGSSNASRPLYDYSANDIGRMSTGDYRQSLAAAGGVQDLQADQIAAIRERPELANATEEYLGDQQQRAQRQGDYARAMGLYGLAQTVGRDIGAPSAVQVRLGNADRL